MKHRTDIRCSASLTFRGTLGVPSGQRRKVVQVVQVEIKETWRTTFRDSFQQGDSREVIRNRVSFHHSNFNCLTREQEDWVVDQLWEECQVDEHLLALRKQHLNEDGTLRSFP